MSSSLEPVPTWVEIDGEIKPSYTGLNSPKYPNRGPEARAAELGAELDDTHSDIAVPLDPTRVIEHARASLGNVAARPSSDLHNATRAYVAGREG